MMLALYSLSVWKCDYMHLQRHSPGLSTHSLRRARLIILANFHPLTPSHPPTLLFLVLVLFLFCFCSVSGSVQTRNLPSKPSSRKRKKRRNYKRKRKSPLLSASVQLYK